jgi:hypothetical protein
MSGKWTRRKLAGAVLGAAAVNAVAQTPSREDDLKAARDRLKAVGDALARQSVPMSTEPAFQFKA